MLVKLALLLSIAIVLSTAQPGSPGSSSPAGPPSTCRVHGREAVDTADIERRLNSGQLGSQPKSALAVHSKPPPKPLRCEDGPRKVFHTGPNGYYYYPKIIRGSCDNLFCKDPPCFARVKKWVTKCVYVFRVIKGKYKFIRRQTIRFLDHLKCGCKKCTDIKSQKQCIATEPCPNSPVKSSFCYWTNKCQCCTPIKCPPHQFFDSTKCQCVCPKGSKKDRRGNCIGDCRNINLRYCSLVQCEDNAHLRCKVDKRKCVCPSCDDVTNTKQCTRTRCLEQRSKPPCRVDPCTKKCRCPRCEEQPDRVWCGRTYCGPNYKFQCDWNPYYRSCSCPH